jgi:hypothetical protein
LHVWRRSASLGADLLDLPGLGALNGFQHERCDRGDRFDSVVASHDKNDPKAKMAEILLMHETSVARYEDLILAIRAKEQLPVPETRPPRPGHGGHVMSR